MKWASQQEGVEDAQRKLQSGRKAEALCTDAEGVVKTRVGDENSVTAVVKETLPTEKEPGLSAQIEQLSRQLDKLKYQLAQKDPRNIQKKRPSGDQRVRKGGCWKCGKYGHLKKDCPGIFESAAVSSLLTVKGSIGGHETNMLVDTGSGVTLIREDVWKQIHAKTLGTLQPVLRSVVTASGEKLKLLGETNVKVSIGGVSGYHLVLVAQQLTQECLLGTDFLSQYGCVVDLRRHVIIAGGKDVPMVDRSEKMDNSLVCFVSTSESVEIPASCQMRLTATVSGQSWPVSEIGIVEPLAKFMNEYGLVVARCISPVILGRIMIQVLNPSPAPVVVSKKVNVGTVEPVQEYCCKVTSAGLQEERNSLLEERIETMLEEAVTLGDKERQRAKELLRNFKDIIALSDDDLGRTRLLYHHIRTGDTQPIRQRARRLPFHQHSQVRKLLNDMLDNGIIEPSTGPWASPIVLVRKKDGGIRFCIDFRKLNQNTQKDAQPLPRIDETLDALDGACYFSTLDLASGYWQVELHPKDKEKTAFVTPFGFYQFRVMPFGLCNAPATFQRLMERVLAGLHWSSCLVYLDDIIVYSRSVEEHLTLLGEVFARLRKAGLKIKPSKCHLLQTSVFVI